MRALRLVAVVTVLGAWCVGGMSTAASATAHAASAKLPDACSLVTSSEITAAFAQAPLEPGPNAVPSTESSSCVWRGTVLDGTVSRHWVSVDVTIRKAIPDKRLRQQAEKQIASQTGYMELPKGDLKGIGERGWIYFNASQGSGSITVRTMPYVYTIRAGYSGGVPVPKVDTAGFLALARLATKQLPS